MRRELIEYLGRNVYDGKLITEKFYYHWNNEEFDLPEQIKHFLKPFDYGKRDNGFNYSVSAFIKGCTEEKLHTLVDFALNECNLSIDKKRFLKSFLSIADLHSDSHYDPIVSFKYNDGLISGMSFYVTALKDKSLIIDYLESVIQAFSLDRITEIQDLINYCVQSRYSDMFQVSWDFAKQPQEQNKIYLKVKDLPNFLNTIKKDYPYLLDYIHIEGFRFCELAFVINEAKLNMFNLYFKLKRSSCDRQVI